MYSEQDLQNISRQLMARISALALPVLLLLSGIVYSFICRSQIVTILLSIVLCCMAIFTWGLFLTPLVKYKRFLKSVLYGMNRTTEGYFNCFVNDQSERDGVLFFPLFINISDTDDEEDDRLFYWDARLPLPSWSKGDKLIITSQDKAVIRWEKQ